jgi:Transposase, Mutator family
MASTLDSDGRLVILAQCIASKENKGNWEIFTTSLVESGFNPSIQFIMSGRDKGLVAAVDVSYPQIPR